MKILAFSIVFLLTLSPMAQGQKNTQVEIFSGYGSFSMNGPREMLKTTVGKSEIPLKLVEDFPSWYTYGIRFLQIINKGKKQPAFAGFTLSSASTGSRAHYQDYSGSLTIDHLARSTTLGILLNKELISVKQFHFGCNGALNLIVTDYRIKSLVVINTFQEEENLTLKSSSFAVEPGFFIRYQILSSLYLKGNASVIFDTSGKLHMPGDRNRYLVDERNNAIRSDWSGLRSSLSIGLSL